MAQKFLTYGFVFLLLLAGKGFGQEQPEPPIITSITVIDSMNNSGAVELFWNDKNAIHADGYFIFRYEDGFTQGFELIGSASYPAFSFFDSSANANIHSESYEIAAYRGAVNNLSINSDTSSTIYLRPIEFDTCAQTATLNWSPYMGWTQGIDGYKVIRNGVELSTSYKKDTTFIDKNVVLGTNYEYVVKARAKGTGNFTSESNRVEILFTSYQKPDSNLLYINELTNRGSTVEIKTHVDVSADIKKYALISGIELNGVYDTVLYNQDVTANLINFVPAYNGTPLFYKVAAMNNCQQIAGQTQHVKPLQLQVAMQDFDVTLSWDSSFVDATSEEYVVFVSIDAAAAEPKGNTKKFNLNDLGTETSEKFCFFVEANDNNGNKSISQTECVTRTPVVEIPEAFSPNGDIVNDHFGPFVNSSKPENSYIKDVSVTAFKLYVYDRYGGIVFYSNDAYDFWDGTKNGVSVSEGAYLYHYTYTTSLGKSYEGSGAINVVYP